jgi:hypothetical protein
MNLRLWTMASLIHARLTDPHEATEDSNSPESR